MNYYIDFIYGLFEYGHGDPYKGIFPAYAVFFFFFVLFSYIFGRWVHDTIINPSFDRNLKEGYFHP